MNKSELIQTAAALSGLSQVETAKALSGILSAIKQSLAKEESVTLVGFGTFSVKERAARKGFNPKTREPLDIQAAKVIRFKSAKKAGE